MNCTNKEQETCDVEKRTCEGCYYNDEIKVGEWIRTLRGDICKVLSIRKKSRFTSNTGHACVSPERYFVDNPKRYSISKPYVKKHSRNIIDLIEVGDYVNGEKVAGIFNPMFLSWEELPYVIAGIGNHYEPQDIKTVVTHEQFKSIEYTIHEREEKENE